MDLKSQIFLHGLVLAAHVAIAFGLSRWSSPASREADGWYSLCPSVELWAGAALAGWACYFLIYQYHFVASAGSDADQQMSYLLALCVAFFIGFTMISYFIATTIRKSIRWNSTYIQFLDNSRLLKLLTLKSISNVKRTIWGEISIEFEGKDILLINSKMRGYRQLVEAICASNPKLALPFPI